MSAWSIDVVVAGHTWTVTDLDPATPGPTSPLTIRHALPDDQLWPAQPLPMAATFGLIAETAAELADVVEGADAHLVFTAPPNPDPVAFDGNVTDVEITPARFTPDPAGPAVDGVRVTVTAIGYLVQLWEWPVTLTEGTGDEGVTDAVTRINSLFSEAGAPWTWPKADPEMSFGAGFPDVAPSLAWNDFVMHNFAPLNVEGESIGPHLDAVLRVWLWADEEKPDDEPRRVIIEPLLDPVTRELGAPYAWQARLVDNEVTLTPAADLELTATGWGVVVDPDAGGNVISAGMVETDIKFVQRKRANTSKVVVPYYAVSDTKAHTLSADNGKRPAVMHTLPGDGGDLPAVDIGQSPDTIIGPIADFYLPEPTGDNWGVDTVVWRMDRDAPGRTPPELGALVIIAGVAETQNPNGKAWITGLVRAWTLTLPDATVDLDLATANARVAPDPAGDPLTWADMPAGPTWETLRPVDTWEDYDLLRGP